MYWISWQESPPWITVWCINTACLHVCGHIDLAFRNSRSKSSHLASLHFIIQRLLWTFRRKIGNSFNLSSSLGYVSKGPLQWFELVLWKPIWLVLFNLSLTSEIPLKGFASEVKRYILFLSIRPNNSLRTFLQYVWEIRRNTVTFTLAKSLGASNVYRRYLEKSHYESFFAHIKHWVASPFTWPAAKILEWCVMRFTPFYFYFFLFVTLGNAWVLFLLLFCYSHIFIIIALAFFCLSTCKSFFY